MRQVALAGGHAAQPGRHDQHRCRGTLSAAPSRADRCRCPARRSSHPTSSPRSKGEPDLGREAVKYLAVMALVDGALDQAKLARVLDYARALDVEEDYLTEMVEAASGHMAWAHRRHDAQEFRQRPQPPSDGLDPAAWIMPYAGDNAEPDLVARYEALGELPTTPSARHCGNSTRRTATPSRAIRRRSTRGSARRMIRRT